MIGFDSYFEPREYRHRPSEDALLLTCESCGETFHEDEEGAIYDADTDIAYCDEICEARGKRKVGAK